MLNRINLKVTLGNRSEHHSLALRARSNVVCDEDSLHEHERAKKLLDKIYPILLLRHITPCRTLHPPALAPWKAAAASTSWTPTSSHSGQLQHSPRRTCTSSRAPRWDVGESSESHAFPRWLARNIMRNAVHQASVLALV